MRSLVTRLKRLENVEAAKSIPRIGLQLGYLKKLPREYTGPRHVVTVAQLPNGHYQWEERPGAPPAEGSDAHILRVNFVRTGDSGEYESD